MSERAHKIVISVFVFLFCFSFFSYHLATSSRVDSSRDALMFGASAGSSRHIHIRTDFASFYYACKAVTRNGNVYDAKYLDSLASADGVANHVLPYLYPPFFAIVAQTLANLSPTTAQHVWDYTQIVSLCLIAVLVLLSAVHREAAKAQHWLVGGVVCAAVIVFPFKSNIDFGQINFLVLLFILLSFFFCFNKQSDWLAGMFLSLAALIKVTPALFLVFFFVNKRWKVLSGFLVGMLIFVLATFDISSKEPWRQFIEFLPNMGYARNVEGGFHPSIVANFSLAGFFMRVFVGEAKLVRILTMSSAVVLFGILLFNHLKYRSERNEASFILPYLVLMVIASPVTWLHHLVYLFPGVVFFLSDWRLEIRDWRRVAPFGLMLLLVVFAMINYQSIYPLLTISEEMRPFVTSMNLLFLILIFFMSLQIVKRKVVSQFDQTETLPSGTLRCL